jgi:hypothetical protein
VAERVFLLPFATTPPGVEPIYRRLVPHRQPFPIRVDGQLDRGVTELPLDVAGSLALLQEAGKRVAEPKGQ